MRSDATLVKDFDSFPDKNLAWDCLIKLANDKDSNVQWRIARLLSIFFLKVPEKYKAWKDLISLLDNRNPIVRRYAVRSLGLAYSYVSDKTETWEYLHKLTKNKSVVLREGIAHSLGYAFPYTSYKQQAWEDILEMTSDENRNIRLNASKSLVSSVVYVPDKRQAWNDLTKLTRNQDKNIRWYAARSFGSIFTDMPDKQKAWKDLVEMTKNEDKHIQGGAIHSIECAYSYVHDEQEAWEDLVKIADKNDKDISLQINHLLGKICINKASQSKNEEEYKKELENAIGFFEKAYTESSYFSPSKFCLPFYRSFYTIIFSERQQQAEKIVDKYLSDAKNAIGSSENKKLLLEAVKNLADALKEVQNLQKMDFDTKKKELNFYRKYCEQTAELMNETEKAAPYVTIVIRKGLPILDRNLKTLLEEIKEKAKTACLGSKGTRTEVIACAVSREVQKWEIGSQEEMTQKVEDVAYLLKTKVVNLPENEYVLNKIEAMRHERDINRQYEALLFVIGQIPTMKVVSEQDLDHKFHKLDLAYDKTISIEDKLSCVSYDIFKIKVELGNLIIPNLSAIKKELVKLNEIVTLSAFSTEKLNSQAGKSNELNNDILERLEEIRILIDELPKNNDTKKIIDSLRELKQSDSDMLMQRSSEIISLIGFVIQVVQLYTVKPV